MTQTIDNKLFRILIVDDTPKNIQLLGTILRNEGFQLNVAQSGLQVFKVLETTTPDLILLDVMMPEMDGFETCKRLKESEATKDIPVIFLTAKTETSEVVKGFELGAVDYVSKPFSSAELLMRVRSHLTIRALQTEVEKQNMEISRELEIAQELFSDACDRLDGPLMGDSPEIRAVRDAILVHAQSDNPVLIVGPPDSGAESAARAIHRASGRKAQAFIYVNCVHHKDAGKSKLFEKTLADPDTDSPARSAIYELARGGTIYLDGIQFLSHRDLAKLSSNIGEQRQTPDDSMMSVRVIAYLSDGAVPSSEISSIFPGLHELFDGNLIAIPSLSQRREDIPTLADFYAKQHGKHLAKEVEKVSSNSIGRLNEYTWPGSLGELQNIVQRSVVVSTGPVVEVAEELLINARRVDQYRLVEELGRGGMGEVWVAKHQLLTRPTALKLIRADRIGEGKQRQIALERFEREAQTTAMLQSPHTIKLFDYGVTEEGAFYFVMELLSGMNLDEIVSQFGPMKPERVTVLLAQACRSLMEAHEIGYTHRDIKAQNLFVCKLGLEFDFLKVLDFGVVKHSDESEDTKKLTGETALPATPITVAPEIAMFQEVDARADLYSLGCVAYWMLTGRHVFEAETLVKLLMHHVSKVPDPPSKHSPFEIPEKLEQIILACLEKEPCDRPSSASEMWEQLSDIEFSDPWSPGRAEQWWTDFAPDIAGRKTECNSPISEADAIAETRKIL